MKAKTVLAVVLVAIVAVGCTQGVRELKEGAAAEARGDWATAEEKYEASARAGNGEAFCRLAGLLTGRKTEELFTRETRDVAWREEAEAIATRLNALRREGETHGFRLDGIGEGVMRLEKAIATSKETEERQQEAERLEAQIAEVEAKREEPEAERRRLVAEIGKVRDEIMACARASQELRRVVEEGQDIRNIRRLVAVLDTCLHAAVGEEAPAVVDRLMSGGSEACLEVAGGLDRRLAAARARLEKLQGPWKDVMARLRECDEKLSALQVQLIALETAERRGTGP